MTKAALSGPMILLAVLLAAGCSSSPKEDIVEKADEECSKITKQFTGDLALGKEFGGPQDQTKLEKRAALIRGLHDRVQKMPAPESALDRDALKRWLEQLITFADKMDDLRGLDKNVRQGLDTLLALSVNVVDEAADGTGSWAVAFGFDDCAKSAKWRIFAKKS